jgi:predicted membrane protein
MSGYERRSSGGEWVGLIIVLIGFWLLMRTMGIFPLFPFGWMIHRFWVPALFIGLGVLLLTRRQTRERGFLGSFFILFGVFFLFGSMNLWGFEYRKWIGPAILIWLGVVFLMKGQRSPREPFQRPEGFQRPDPFARPQSPKSPFNSEPSTDSSDFIHATAILGAFNRRCLSQQFRGGDVTTIMGGGKVDLRDAQIGENDARVDVFTLMGAIEIQVPPGWTVEPRLTPILGGFEDKTNREQHGAKRLIIDGTAVMGSVIISN